MRLSRAVLSLMILSSRIWGALTSSSASSDVAYEMADSGFFFFDSAGRPFNRNDTVGGTSSFARLTLNVDSGNQRATLNIEAETGYVF